MQPVIDKKGLLHVCDTVNTIHERRRYIYNSLKNVKKDFSQNKANIDLDAYEELIDFLEEELSFLAEDIRSKALRMEKKLFEYKNSKQKNNYK